MFNYTFVVVAEFNRGALSVCWPPIIIHRIVT